MKNLIIVLLILLFACQNEKVKVDKTEKKKPWEHYNKMLNTIHRYPLHYGDTTKSVIRLSYKMVLDSWDRFYEVNLKTGELTYILFHTPNPRWTYYDTIPKIFKSRLFQEDIDTLYSLIEASMIWSLEASDSSYGFNCNCDDYTYEAIRPFLEYEKERKTYTILHRHCPSNSDFIKLGSFLKYKSKSKNHEGKIYYWQ